MAFWFYSDSLFNITNTYVCHTLKFNATSWSEWCHDVVYDVFDSEFEVQMDDQFCNNFGEFFFDKIDHDVVEYDGDFRDNERIPDEADLLDIIDKKMTGDLTKYIRDHSDKFPASRFESDESKAEFIEDYKDGGDTVIELKDGSVVVIYMGFERPTSMF